MMTKFATQGGGGCCSATRGRLPLDTGYIYGPALHLYARDGFTADEPLWGNTDFNSRPR